jgi:hypothetical protein
MRFQHTSVVCLVVALWGATACAQQTGKKAAPAEASAPLRFPVAGQRLPFYGKVATVEKDGSVQINRYAEMMNAPAGMRQELTEGYFMGIVKDVPGPSLAGARLVRVQITDVGEDEAVQAQVARKAAESLKEGNMVILVRPAGATTARMKQLPDLVPLEEGPPPAAKKNDSADQMKLTQSFNNLKMIGLALHNFHDVYRHFPPATIVGPDNKPWHSWRVLILPFVDQAPLYNQYKFDEPWDGPTNRKLLDKLPPVYSDPVYGENKEYFTHYVAITGDDMAFTSEGADFDGKNIGPAIGGGRGIAQFTDGTSNTLVVGPVGPDRKIPWMKPEDLAVDDRLPGLGKKGGFAAPYKLEKGTVSPFLLADGAVRGILDTIDGKTLHALLTLDGGEAVGEYPTINPPAVRMALTPVIYIMTEANQTTARLVMEAVEQTIMLPGTGLPPGAVPGAPVPARVPLPPPGIRPGGDAVKKIENR